MSSRESASIHSKQSAPRKNSSKALSLHDSSSSSQPKKQFANNLKASDNILDLSLLTQSTHVSGIGKNIQEIARDNSFFCKIILRPIEQKPLGFDSFCTPKKGSFLEDLNSNSSQKKNFNYYGRYRFQSAASNKIQLRLNTDPQRQENAQPIEKPKSAVFDMTISGLSTIRSLHEGQQSHRSCKSSVFTNYSERIKTDSSGNPHNKAGFSYTLGLKSQQSETDKQSFDFQLINQQTLPKNYSNTITFNEKKREPSKEDHHHSYHHHHQQQQQQQQQQLGKQVYDAQELKRHRTYHSSKIKRIPTIQHNFEWENL